MAGFMMLVIMFAFVFVCAVFAKPIIAMICILTGDKEGLHDANLCEEKYYKSLYAKWFDDKPVRPNSYDWRKREPNNYNWRNKGEGNMN